VVVLPARSCYRARQHPTNASIPLTQQPFPGSVDQITPDWLSRSPGIAVTGVQATRIGQDEGFSGCRLYRLGLVRHGAGVVGYLMISSLAPALRRQHERALVDLDQTALDARAVPGNDTDGYVPAAAGKLWITVAATLQYDNASPAKQRWRRTDLERLAAFCADHNPAAAFV